VRSSRPNPSGGEAGDGFVTAASGLEAFATAIENAKTRAGWAEGEYARGEQVTTDARAAYDADVAAARRLRRRERPASSRR
jgi:hypothetical protein